MRISVVIPLWNKEKEIARTLESVKRQTVAPAEVIVVNDGSTDSGPEIVRNFDLPNLRLVSQENAGEGAARNTGIREAREDIVAFLDADDTWEPGFLAAIADMIRKYPGCAMYGTAWRIRTANGKVIIPPFRDVPAAGTDGVLKSYFATVSKGMCLCSSSVAVIKHVFDKVGGFPVGVKLGGDRETWLRIAVDHPVAFCNRILATWQQSASNRSCTVYKHDREHTLLHTGMKVLSRSGLPPKARQELRRYLTRTQIFIAKQLIRQGRQKEARELLFQCLDPKAYWWKWSICLVGSFFPVSIFSALYLAKCRISESSSRMRHFGRKGDT